MTTEPPTPPAYPTTGVPLLGDTAADPARLAVRAGAGAPVRALPDRKEAEVRRMLDVPHPAAPPDLAERAMARGRRLLRRRRALHALWALLLAAAVVTAVVLAVLYGHTGPSDVTPPLRVG